MTEPCECTSYCGDDERADRGERAPCENRRRAAEDRAQLLADVVILVAFATTTRNRPVAAALSRVLARVSP